MHQHFKGSFVATDEDGLPVTVKVFVDFYANENGEWEERKTYLRTENNWIVRRIAKGVYKTDSQRLTSDDPNAP